MADLGTAVRSYIAADSGVSALVSTRIYPDVLPQGYKASDGPALTYEIISTVHDHMLNGLAGIARSRIEFIAYASTRAGCNAVAEAVRTSGIVGYTGNMNGVLIESVMIDMGVQTQEEGPTDGQATHRYLAMFDYLFAYQETT